MKHFPKSQCDRELLRQVMLEEERPFEVTKDEVMKWFSIINSVIFNNTLPPFHKIGIEELDEVWAWFEHFEDLNEHHLTLHHTYETKQVFINILAHEMVHMYQQINNQPVGHGPSFRQWRHMFENNFLTLQRKW